MVFWLIYLIIGIALAGSDLYANVRKYPETYRAKDMWLQAGLMYPALALVWPVMVVAWINEKRDRRGD